MLISYSVTHFSLCYISFCLVIVQVFIGAISPIFVAFFHSLTFYVKNVGLFFICRNFVPQFLYNSFSPEIR